MTGVAVVVVVEVALGGTGSLDVSTPGVPGIGRRETRQAAPDTELIVFSSIDRSLAKSTTAPSADLKMREVRPEISFLAILW